MTPQALWITVVLLASAPPPPALDEELPAATQPAPQRPARSNALWDGVWDVLVATAGGCLGAGCGAGGVLACAGVAAGGCTGFLVAREFAAGGTTYIGNAGLDGLLYSLLILFASIPVVLGMGALGDAVGYNLALPIWQRRFSLALLWPLLASAAAMAPGVVVLLLGGVVFLSWLTVQQLPDVLMLVGLGTLGAGALLVLVGAVLVRPLLHLGMHTLWARRDTAEDASVVTPP